ncbi:MAG: hypothetical protein IK099_08270 [Clostridia bacterium]|nr:hypothetical protein [Clostridia bacterium]
MMMFLKQLTGLCLFRLVLDFILPEGEASRYAAFGVELCFMLCMIGGAARLLQGG